MLRSLKSKFALVFSSILIVVLIGFSTILFGIINQRVEQEIIQDRIEQILQNHPGLGEFFRGQQLRDQYRLIQIAEYFEEQVTEKYNRTLIMLLFPTAILSVGLGYVTAHVLVRPIDKLSDDVKQLSSGRLEGRIPKDKSSTEIEYLRDSFNTLLGDVEQAFNSQEEFIQDAAHELRTPLASMRANLDNLDDQEKPSISEYQKAIKVLSDMNRKLIHLSEDLFYLDRRNSSEFSKVVLKDLIEDVAEDLHPLIARSGVDLTINVSKEHHTNGDPKTLARAFRNIIENAIKYRSKNPKISISSSVVDDRLLIKIKDNGIGITPTELPHIFDRFYRGDQDTSIDGTGLGLAIVKKVVEEHSGNIKADSIEGKGATFTVDLPSIK